MEPVETYVIDDPGTLKAVADPLRMRLLMLLESPCTAKQAAAALDVPATRLYYHLQILEDHGLIRVVRRRKVSGIEERTYQSVARNWTLSEEMAASSLESAGVLGALLDLVHAEMAVALEEHGGPLGATTRGEMTVLSLAPLAFTPDQVKEFFERLHRLLEEFSFDQKKAPPEGTRIHHFFVAGYPVSGRGRGDAGRG